MKELSRQPDIYERLTKSLAPNIWELDDVKKGLLCQVLQSSSKTKIDCANPYVLMLPVGLILNILKFLFYYSSLQLAQPYVIK